MQTEQDMLVEYNVTEAKLAEMRTRLVPRDCTNKEGYEFTRKGIAECRELRDRKSTRLNSSHRL